MYWLDHQDIPLELFNLLINLWTPKNMRAWVKDFDRCFNTEKGGWEEGGTEEEKEG